MIARIFENLFFGTCLLSINLIVLAVSTLLGWVPAILRWIAQTVRGFLVISQRFYSVILSSLAYLIARLIGFDITTGFIRGAACLLLSFCLGLVLLTLVKPNNPFWILGTSILHGLAVGIAWDELGEPDGLRLGTRLE
jgi:hypothetical protein